MLVDNDTHNLNVIYQLLLTIYSTFNKFKRYPIRDNFKN